MIKLLFLCLVFQSSQAFSKDNYFQLYAQGKVVESIHRLEKELNQNSYNPLALNTQFQILLSAYFSHLAISDKLTLKILKSLKAQLVHAKSRQTIDSDIDGFMTELESILTQNPSLNATRSLLNSAITQSSARRLTQLQVLAIFSHRRSLQATTLEARAAWLFVSGKAGFYRYNSGHQELAAYIKLCEQLEKEAACSQLGEAQRMHELGSKVSGID